MKLLNLLLCFLFLGCGVKGPPLPPDTPTEIGRGKPSYQRAMRKVPIDNYADEYENEDEDEDDEE